MLEVDVVGRTVVVPKELVDVAVVVVAVGMNVVVTINSNNSNLAKDHNNIWLKEDKRKMIASKDTRVSNFQMNE